MSAPAPQHASRRAAVIRGSLAFAVALAAAHAAAQVPLKSREVAPSIESTHAFIAAVTRSSNARHGLATFNRHVSADDRAGLERIGVRVLSPFYGTTYRVRVGPQIDSNALLASPLEPRLLLLEANDRINPILLGNDFKWYSPKANGQPAGPNWVLSADEQAVAVAVRLQPGVTDSDARRLLRRYFIRPRKQADAVWRITIERARLRELLEEDSVQWIDAGPLPFRPDSDRTRAAVNVDPLQTIDMAGTVTGLTGKGVQVGVFDKGVSAHRAFEGRLVKIHGGRDFHGTHVAGIIGGSGALSDAVLSGSRDAGSKPRSWRGMAPGVAIIDVYQNPPHGRSGADALLYQQLIAKHGMDISNHSYAVNFFHPMLHVDGSYDVHNQLRDELIRGDAIANRKPVPARLQVSSAGNRGDLESFSINKQSKNALVVGAWKTRSWRPSAASAQGPTSDGRIKPDVMAPGVDIVSAGYCAAGDSIELDEPKCVVNKRVVETTDFYRGLSGTSQATPVVTGVLALVLQQYRKSFGVDLDTKPPLPSTLRAVLIHTARNNPKAPEAIMAMPDALSPSARARIDEELKKEAGDPVAAEIRRRQPSFVSGWGLIDAAAAVQAVQNRALVEDTLAGTCDSVTYAFELQPPRDGLVRFTLGWDDVRSDPALANEVPKLLNDLDLVVTSPTGEVFHPWQIDQDYGPATARRKLCREQLTPKRHLTRLRDAGERKMRAAEVRVQRGPDHLNNVEVVDAPWSKGSWSVRVIGFNIADGPQKFSLIGVPPEAVRRDTPVVDGP